MQRTAKLSFISVSAKFFTFAILKQLKMNMEEFIKNIEAEFDDLKPGVLKADSNFRESFEWNSINALILIAMVKTEYDVTLSADDLIKSKSVKDIYSLIVNRQS
ncbi:MAG: acyl carrier protein [Bacteroidales bacterium]|nr:acyl carrier protein [Bacteroidales bacterium]